VDGLQALGLEKIKDWVKGSRYLVHLDEEAVNEVPRVLGVQGCFIDLDPGCYEVLKILYQVVQVIMSSWQILHDSRVHII
jgi:hypothetical protein